MRVKLARRTLCAGLAVVAAAAVTAPAQAASPFLRSTSNCLTGHVALGGGSQVVGQGSADFRTSLQESAPGTANGQSVWLTAIRNNDVSPHTIGLFAVCARPLSGYQVVRKDVSVPAGGFLRNTAACPVGKVALAGGAQVVGEGTADFRTSLQESAPGTINGGAQHVWLVALRNRDIKAHTIGLFAVCANPPLGYQKVRKDVVVPAGGFLRSTAICPSGKVVMGGGSSVIGEGSADFRTPIQESAPGTINGGAQSLHLTALRNRDIKSHTIGLHAVCASPPAGYNVVRKDVVTG